MEQIKQQIYEITGISDIVRGQTDPNETLGAQQMKGQYATLRLRAMQEDVSRYATELLQLKAQIMCRNFSPQTLVKISGAEQLSPQDQELIPQALAVLVGPERMMDPNAKPGPNPLRSFRVEVSADSLVQLDEETEKQNRVEFLTATSGFMEKLAMIGQAAPDMVPLGMELLKFGVTGFKVGKTIEGAFDTALDAMKQKMANPQPPPPDPKLEATKIKAEADIAKTKSEMTIAPIKAQAETTKAQAQVITAQTALQTAQVNAMAPKPEQPNA